MFLGRQTWYAENISKFTTEQQRRVDWSVPARTELAGANFFLVKPFKHCDRCHFPNFRLIHNL